jgi:hypothetical protein
MNTEEQLTRYNAWHNHNAVTFYLEEFIPDLEECRILMLKLIEQVVRDYLLLKDSEFLNDRYAWETAASFIYDEDYRFNWGEMELSPEDFLGIVDIDISWFRMHIGKRFEEKYGDKHGKEEGRSSGRSSCNRKQRR